MEIALRKIKIDQILKLALKMQLNNIRSIKAYFFIESDLNKSQILDIRAEV